MQEDNRSILLTTVCICGDGLVYDLEEGEYPPCFPGNRIRDKHYKVVDAFTIPVDKVAQLRKRKGKR